MNDKQKVDRRRLSISRRVLGIPLVPVTVTIPPEVAEWLVELGQGNRSAGVRFLYEQRAEKVAEAA